MRDRLDLKQNRHGSAVHAVEYASEFHLYSYDHRGTCRELIALDPGQITELGDWLVGEEHRSQLAIRDSRIEELEAREAELETAYCEQTRKWAALSDRVEELEAELGEARCSGANGPAWDYGPGQPYEIPPEGDA